MAKKGVLRAGVVGAGNIGQGAHLPAYKNLPETELVALCDTDQERLDTIAEQYGIPKEFRFLSHEEMYAKANLDVVSIGTPTWAHHEETISALNNDIHVLCEKPIAMNTKETIDMVKTAKEKGKVLGIGYNNRFTNESQTLKSYIDEGLFGDLYYAKCGWLRRRGNPHGWFTKKDESGGGPLIDCGVHALDLGWWLMGAPQPVSVLASTYCKFGNYDVEGIGQYWAMSGNEDGVFDTEDLATALIKFSDGSTIFFDVSWALNGENRFYAEVYGDKAGAEWSPFKIYGMVGKNIADIHPVLNLRVNAQEAKVANFVRHILGEEDLLCPGSQTIAISQIVDAIYESGSTGKVVEIKPVTI